MGRIFLKISRVSKIVTGLLMCLVTGYVFFPYPDPCAAATFIDAVGRTIKLESPPRRIVSMAPSVTEILYYLGLGDRIVGVTQFSYYPPEALQKPKIGSFINLNAEKIVSLNPDLAIGTADGNKESIVRLLEQAGIDVYIVNPQKVRDVIETIVTLGELCDMKKRAKELAYQLSRRIDHVSKRTATRRKPLVFLQINAKPIMTVNKNTFLHDVIRLAGGENMAKDIHITYPRINVEEILRMKPEVIIISTMERGGDFEESRRGWLKWSDIPAILQLFYSNFILFVIS